MPALLAALPLGAAEPVATTEIIISHGPPQRGPAVDEVMPGLLRCRDTLPSPFSASLAVTGRLEAEDGKGRLKTLALEKTGKGAVRAGLMRCVLKELSEARLPQPAEGGISLRYLLHFRLAPPRSEKGVARQKAAVQAPEEARLASRPESGGFPRPMMPRPVARPAPKRKAPKAPVRKEPSQEDEDAKAREALRQAAVNALKLTVDSCFRRGVNTGTDRYLTLRFDVVLVAGDQAGFEKVSAGVASTAEQAVSDCAVSEVKGVTFRIAPELARVFPPEGLETSYPFTAP